MGNSSSSNNHQQLGSNFTRGTFGDIKNVKSSSFRGSKRSSPKRMDRLRKSFRDSFKRRKDRVPEASKPHMWQSDETEVKNATCVFPVKYLGCVEVFESRGMQVCEEAVKVLRSSRRRPVRGQLHVSGDGLRVVDEDTKGLLVDQTIEKVSFCAPDRSHERGFSYICRDGTTRRWMCHGFLASKDSGERLSHAVGCAFAVCLERKQRRDKECTVTGTFDSKTSTFTRTGSFRQTTMTERLVDPPSAIVLPQKAHNPFAIERPHATPSMLERQGSFRGFQQMGAQSPFKRQMSLRINDLPSNAERQKAFLDTNQPQRMAVSPIPEVSPNQMDFVSEMCKELREEIGLLTKKDTEEFLNFEKLANGIISGKAPIILDSSAMSADTSAVTTTTAVVNTKPTFINKPAPPKTVTSPITSVTPYRPLMSIAHTGPLANFVPLRKAMPILHKQLIDDDSPEIPVRSIVSTTNATSTISSVYEQKPRTPSPALGLALATVPADASPSSPQKVVPIETVNPLPKADQWLTNIVKNSSPSPRRAPAFNIQSRSKSLAPGDPFDTTVAEWATGANRPEIHSTNPFITPPKTSVQQSFQVQL